MNSRTERRLGAIEEAVHGTDTRPAIGITIHQGEDGLFSANGKPPFYAMRDEVVAAVERERGIRVCSCIILATPPPLPDEDYEEVTK